MLGLQYIKHFNLPVKTAIKGWGLKPPSLSKNTLRVPQQRMLKHKSCNSQDLLEGEGHLLLVFASNV